MVRKVKIEREFVAIDPKKVVKKRIVVGMRDNSPVFENQEFADCPFCGTRLRVVQNPTITDGLPHATCIKGCEGGEEPMVVSK